MRGGGADSCLIAIVGVGRASGPVGAKNFVGERKQHRPILWLLIEQL